MKISVNEMLDIIQNENPYKKENHNDFWNWIENHDGRSYVTERGKEDIRFRLTKVKIIK